MNLSYLKIKFTVISSLVLFIKKRLDNLPNVRYISHLSEGRAIPSANFWAAKT